MISLTSTSRRPAVITHAPLALPYDDSPYPPPSFAGAPWLVYQRLEEAYAARPDWIDTRSVVAVLPFRALPLGALVTLGMLAERTGRTLEATVDALADVECAGMVVWDYARQGIEFRDVSLTAQVPRETLTAAMSFANVVEAESASFARMVFA